jgi:microcin C transport system permease protein
MKKKSSLIILIALLLTSLFTPILLDDKPIFIKYKNQYFLPHIAYPSYNSFNLDYNLQANFKDENLIAHIKNNNGYIVYPIFGLVNSVNQKYLDMLSSIKYIFFFGIIPTLISLILGLSLGIAQGYMGTKYDFILQRIYEVIISIPILYLIIFINLHFSLNIFNLAIILGILNYGFFLIYIRKITFSIKEQPNIVNLEFLNINKTKIMYKYIQEQVLRKISPLIGFLFVANNLSIITLDFLNINYQQNIKTIGYIIINGLYNDNNNVLSFFAIALLVIISLNILKLTNFNKHD